MVRLKILQAVSDPQTSFQRQLRELLYVSVESDSFLCAISLRTLTFWLSSVA